MGLQVSSASLRIYTVVFASVASAAIARKLVDFWLPQHFPLATFLVAVLFSAWYGGRGAALVAIVLGALWSDFLFIEPRGSLAIDSWRDRVAIILFILVGLIGTRLIEALLTARRGAEQSAAEAEKNREWLRVILSSVGDGVISVDLPGRITFLNSAAEAITGWTMADAQGRPWEEVLRLVREGSREPIANPALEVARGGAPLRLEGDVWLWNRRGETRPIEGHAAPIRTGEEPILGVVFVFRDVSDQRRSGDAQRHLAAIVQSSDDAIIGETLDGRITSWNSGAERLYGYQAEEVLGKTTRLLIPADHPQDESEVLERIRQAEQRVQYEAVRRRKDGTLIQVGVTVSPIQDSLGRLIGASTIARDITQQRRADEAIRVLNRDLQRRIAEFQTLLDVIPISIAVADDPQCERVWVNPTFSRLLRLAPGSNASLTAAPEERPTGFRLFQQGRELLPEELPLHRVTATGQVLRDLEFEAVLQDGTRVQFLGYAAPLFDENLQVRGGILAAVDITERDRALAERRQAEQTLRENEERLRMALEAGRMGTWEWDISTNRVQWSPGLEAIHGLAPGTFPGTFEAYQSDIHPDDREYVLQSVQQTLVHDRDHHLEYRLVWPDESIHWVEARGKLFKDESGKPVRMIGVCMDVSGRKRLEQNLRQRMEEVAEAEGRIRSVVNHVVDGIITIDESGTVQTFNPAAERIFGYAASEVIGRNVRMLMPPPYRQEHDLYLERYRRTGEGRIIGSGREVLGLRKDRSTFPLDLAVSEFLLDEQRLFTGIVRDITERKRAEDTERFLSHASATLASLVDYRSTLQTVAGLPLPFFCDWCAIDMLDAEGELRRVAVAHADPAKVQAAEELNRRYPPDPQAPQGVWSILRSGKTEWVAEVTPELIRQHTPDRELAQRLVELQLRSYIGVPLLARGKVLGVLTFLMAESKRNFTAQDLPLAEELAHRAAVAIENAQLYEALREADRRKDEFLAMLGHELRNPLAPLRNALQLLRMPNVALEEINIAKEMMERQLEQMVRLVDDLLDMSRIMRGKIELQRERVELAALVERAVETAQPVIQTHEHQLLVQLPPEPVMLEVDSIRFAQIISNLLTNAAKYTERGGQITLLVEREGGEVVIRVRDTGIGIAPEALHRIFDLFVQVEPLTRRSQSGLGIGLTLVKNLTELHGGRVSAYSAGLGKGSEFSVRMPLLSPEPPAPRPDKSGAREQPAAASQRRVLVVDDNVDAARSLAMLLRLDGHAVQLAHDGLTALRLVAEQDYELALLDLGMPTMDGYTLARRLRELPGGRRIVLVAVTGWGQEEDRRRTEEAGFQHHLVKPVELHAIRQIVAELPPATVAEGAPHPPLVPLEPGTTSS